MRRFLVALCALLFSALPVYASGKVTGRCLLQVNGRTYMDSQQCSISLEDDGGFEISSKESKYFAYVEMEDGVAKGYWNDDDGEPASHAHTDLGILHRKGGCWVNEQAQVCAYK